MSATEILERVGQICSASPLAVKPGAPVAQQAREYLTFRLGGEEYGIDILIVQEIRGYEAPTRIANAPSYVKGVVNLRGVIVPIFDLRVKLGLERVNYDSSTVTVILSVGGRVVGAVVDSVSDVVNLEREQIKPAPQFNAAVNAGFITGIGVLEHGEQRRMLILVDIDRLMPSAETGLAEQLLQQAVSLADSK